MLFVQVGLLFFINIYYHSSEINKLTDDIERLNNNHRSEIDQLEGRIKSRDDVITKRDEEIAELNVQSSKAFDKAQQAIEQFKKQANEAQQVL